MSLMSCYLETNCNAMCLMKTVLIVLQACPSFTSVRKSNYCWFLIDRNHYDLNRLLCEVSCLVNFVYK